MGQKTVVVGAGPVGALAALYAARRGDNVEIYELRNDLRDPLSTPLNFTKSINLAVSERGINALRQSQSPHIVSSILNDTIPMRGRMIHGLTQGRLYEAAQNYDVNGRAILAMDRSGLNKIMLDELEQMPNVKIFFNHKLTGADFKRRRAWFEPRQPWRGLDKNLELREKRAPEIEISFDFLIGADGAHSAARYHMMKYARVSFEQEYIDTIWCEFRIDPGQSTDGTETTFRISPNHLHIWPAGSFMFIAIPSSDKSFVCTLFMSAIQFDAIDNDPDSLIPFFTKNFPGVVPDLIPAAQLQQQYKQNPHLPLVSVKCAPYHYGSSVVIVGDAAHAMVPFYGQGMNAGFEDVRVLYDILDKHMIRPALETFSDQSVPLPQPSQDSLRAEALREYTGFRVPDAHTINDLAMGNFVEMRSSVRSRGYLLRKRIEELLSVWIPALGFKTQYSRVSFSNERYSELVEHVHRQHVILDYAAGALGIAAAGIAFYVWHVRRR